MTERARHSVEAEARVTAVADLRSLALEVHDPAHALDYQVALQDLLAKFEVVAGWLKVRGMQVGVMGLDQLVVKATARYGGANGSDVLEALRDRDRDQVDAALLEAARAIQRVVERWRDEQVRGPRR